MTSKKDVEDFLSQKKLAVVGVSRRGNKSGNTVYQELKKRGYQVYAVNPNTGTTPEGDPCYPDLKSLPEKVGGVVVVLPPKTAENVVKEAVQAGIPRIWMQLGSQSPEAIAACQESSITVIAKECIFMFIEPVESVHKFHRWLRKLFGRMPK